MRSRRLIEDSFKTLVVPSGNDQIKLQLEILLDIRELLAVEGDERMTARIEKEERKLRPKRAAKVREGLEKEIDNLTEIINVLYN